MTEDENRFWEEYFHQRWEMSDLQDDDFFDEWQRHRSERERQEREREERERSEW